MKVVQCLYQLYLNKNINKWTFFLEKYNLEFMLQKKQFKIKSVVKNLPLKENPIPKQM